MSRGEHLEIAFYLFNKNSLMIDWINAHKKLHPTRKVISVDYNPTTREMFKDGKLQGKISTNVFINDRIGETYNNFALGT